ncbi:hypothetical protein ACXEGA_000033 [Klebsiella pneumoniae]
MALTLLATNNAESTLASAISATDTSLIVSAGTGAEFPDAVAGESYFKLTLTDAATGSQVEIVNVTAKAGDIFTIERAQEGTLARAWAANDMVANMMTADTLNIIAQYSQQAAASAALAEEYADNASEYAQNKFTFYKTASDPDGTIAGLAATTDGQSFWVAQGPDALSAAWQYQNKAGVAVLQAKQPGTAAVTGTIREFPTLAAAQADADAGNIPTGSTAYYRSADDATLAIEVVNTSGTLHPTGRKTPSVEYIQGVVYDINNNVFKALSDLKKLSLDSESETVLLIDSEGRKLIVADHSGKVIKAYGNEMLSSGSLNTTLQPKFSDQYQYASTDQTEQVLQVDSAGRKLLVLDHANLQLKAYGKPVGANSPYISPTKDFTIIGDSLSVGTVNGATAWRTTLAGLLPGRTFNLEAISGQNSSMIAPRIGAQPPQVTVDGNSIPASGSVNVTACQILSSTGQLVDCQPLTSNGYQTMNGWLCGVYGAFARVSGGTFTFTRAASGSAVYCAPGSPFERDFSDLNFNLMTIWVGRNDISGLTSGNYSERVANLKDRLSRIYDYQLTQEKRTLFVTPPLGGPITAGVVATGEVTGTLPNNFSREISIWMKDKWGDLVLDCVPWSFQYASASADDISDVSLGIVPRSLRTADTPANDTNVHWGTALQTHLANWMYEQVIRRGW